MIFTAILTVFIANNISHMFSTTRCLLWFGFGFWTECYNVCITDNLILMFFCAVWLFASQDQALVQEWSCVLYHQHNDFIQSISRNWWWWTLINQSHQHSHLTYIFQLEWMTHRAVLGCWKRLTNMSDMSVHSLLWKSLANWVNNRKSCHFSDVLFTFQLCVNLSLFLDNWKKRSVKSYTIL